MILVINWPVVTLTFWPLNGVTDHLCHELPSCPSQLATPFRSQLSVRHGTDGQRQRSSLHNAPCGAGAKEAAVLNAEQ